MGWAIIVIYHGSKSGKPQLAKLLLPSNGVTLQFDWITYDDIFEGIDLSIWQTAAALGKLAASGVSQFFGARKRGLFDSIDHTLRWYAGYVVAWVENDTFQAKTRSRVIQKLAAFQPDVLLAHVFGSLVTYNALTHPDLAGVAAAKTAAANLRYVTLGSQIGNAFVVRNLTPGRIEMLPVKEIVHLYNEEDDVFTAPIRLPGVPNFEQVDAFFDIEGFADHDAVQYLTRPATVGRVWKTLVTEAQAVGGLKVKAARLVLLKCVPARAATWCMLVGINDYPESGGGPVWTDA